MRERRQERIETWLAQRATEDEILGDPQERIADELRRIRVHLGTLVFLVFVLTLVVVATVLHGT